MTTTTSPLATSYDLLCFSHLRWDFVYQRPQHLMSRFARDRRVFFIEEPIFGSDADRIDVTKSAPNLYRMVPQLTDDSGDVRSRISSLLEKELSAVDVKECVAWYYTPMMLDISPGVEPIASVYDCMDELSHFKGAPPELIENEGRLFATANLVFTGGRSLFEAKRDKHPSVYAFPSSIEVEHFAKARQQDDEPVDQREIPHPRVGFAGVIDERMDLELLSDMAKLRPDWQFVMIGPVVKIDPADLPRRHNIHYLGMQPYEQLPAYLSGWDAAMMPFALNDSTKFISPTKTPEFLAAGLGVVSTAITDVVMPYAEMGLVHIARTAQEFIDGLTVAMEEDAAERDAAVHDFLKENSWDRTYAQMSELIDAAVGVSDAGPVARRTNENLVLAVA
jgi:UDP-galactopyranose mutase